MLPRIAFPFLISLSDAGPITSDIELKVSIDQFIPRVNSEKFQNFHLLALIVSFQFLKFLSIQLIYTKITKNFIKLTSFDRFLLQWSFIQ